MIHFDPSPEPAHFDETVRQPGMQWLESHPDTDRPEPFWNEVKFELADAFGRLCGYSVMYEPVGTVDHYLSVKNQRDRAYEWNNYRFPLAGSTAVSKRRIRPFLTLSRCKTAGSRYRFLPFNWNSPTKCPIPTEKKPNIL